MKLRVMRLLFVVVIVSLLTSPPPIRECKLFVINAYAADVTTDLPEEKIEGDAVDDDKLMLSPGTVTVIRPQEMKGEQKKSSRTA